MDYKCDCKEEECNHCWNEDVFYTLGLHHVWKINGHWIPDHDRYPEGWIPQLDWYTYCDTFHIPWSDTRLLPNWAIESMDEYNREDYYRYTDRDVLTEENQCKYAPRDDTCCKHVHDMIMLMIG
jgi:hypothetical protein